MNIEFDLKEILTDLKQGQLKLAEDLKQSNLRLGAKIDKLSEDVAGIKTDLAATKAELKGDIKALDTKVDGIGKRVENQELLNRGVVLGLLLAILGGLAKLFGLAGS